ncbi:TPA: adhesin, partial [Escherichia coli]|nr:adhesin [Escherichia coli]
YSYALSQGVDTKFRHINVAEADHFKQFLRQIERVNSKVFF